MKTVQLALRDCEQTQLLRDLLMGDGAHQVHVVEQPDIGIGGVIVMDMERLGIWNALMAEPQRLVVVVPKIRTELAAIWEAGVQHVVFQGDDARTMQVVILATELTLAVDES